MRLVYIANNRIPTEKAHGLQIVQNCEALANAGADVRLWTAARVNTPAMRAIDDLWAYYGVARNFGFRRLPCMDLLPLVPGRTDALAKLIFYLQLATYIVSAVVAALFTRADLFYSRDARVLLALSRFFPARKLAYEAHQLAEGEAGKRLQRAAMRRVGAVIPVTAKLRDGLVALAAESEAELLREKCLVAHDGVRAARFEGMPPQAEARARLGWPTEAFVVGYVGRLHTMTMDKGVGTLIEALASVGDVALALVGGPDEQAEAFREQWRALGLPAEHFLYAGHVPPDDVPDALSAFDVCAMPFPWTMHFAYYASPIKLFEYMASGRAVVSSDLPAFADVVTDGEHALLVSPGDAEALAHAILRLKADPALRSRLGEAARERVFAHYTWAARAEAILGHIRR